MITPSHLLHAIAEECRIMKHLGEKVTAENKDYRLTPSQRSIEELEQYIVSSLPAQVKLMVAGAWNNDVYMDIVNQYSDFVWSQFSGWLDAAYASIQADLLSLTDEQRQEEVSFRGKTGTRTIFLVDYLLSFLGAYKMQLFLQLKASWLSDLGTYNLWSGVDAPVDVN